MDLKQLRFSANQIAAMLGGRVVGDGAREVWNVAPVEAAAEGDLSYVCDAKYLPQLATTGASVVLLTESLLDSDTQAAATLICVPNARVAVAQLLGMVSEAMNPQPKGVEQPCFIAEGVEVPEDAYIGAFAYIGRGVKLGRGVRIYPQTYIGDYTEVGDRTVLYAGVKIYHHCVVGSDCILHSGCVIGADGFGFEPDEKGINRKIPQIGNVVIEDDVEIGANTTIDRAMMGSTLVRRNTKIDNLVQLGHGVQVGESDFLCAQVGVAGSTKIGSHCILAGQVGVAGHLEITDNCILGAQTGVAGSIRQPGAYQGSPHQPAMDWRRSMVGVKQLPQLMREHTQMMRQLSKLENKEDQQ